MVYAVFWDDASVARQATRNAAFHSAPERFVRQTPELPKVPTAVWINLPKNGAVTQA
mgnify:CR=1 FL=1